MKLLRDIVAEAAKPGVFRACAPGIHPWKHTVQHKIRRSLSAWWCAIVIYALMIFVVLGFTGLSVDAGYLQWQRRLMQSAADAAAMGALREMDPPEGPKTAPA